MAEPLPLSCGGLSGRYRLGHSCSRSGCCCCCCCCCCCRCRCRCLTVSLSHCLTVICVIVVSEETRTYDGHNTTLVVMCSRVGIEANNQPIVDESSDNVMTIRRCGCCLQSSLRRSSQLMSSQQYFHVGLYQVST